MFSRVNVKGIILLAVILICIQAVVGLFVSPLVKDLAVEMINGSDVMKIKLEGFNVWPVTLSISIRGLSIYDPDGEERMARIDKALCHLSFLGLISKRVVFNKIELDGAEINLEGEPDGSFNVERLAGSGKGKKSIWSIIDRFKNKDWFTRIYQLIKNRHSSKAVEAEKKQQKEIKKIEREVTELPKGRKVAFKTLSDDAIFEIKDLSIRNARIDIAESNETLLEIKSASVRMTDLSADPVNGVRFGSFAITGKLEKDGSYAGKFSASYKKSFSEKRLKSEMRLDAKDIDLKTVGFIYASSLPVSVDKGMLNIDSITEIVDENIESTNRVILSDHVLVPKNGGPRTVMGVIPVLTLCEALDKANPLKLEFNASGPVASPKITGFEKTFKGLAKPFMENAVKNTGIDKIKSLFNRTAEPVVAGEASTENAGEYSSAAGAINSVKSMLGSGE